MNIRGHFISGRREIAAQPAAAAASEPTACYCRKLCAVSLPCSQDACVSLKLVAVLVCCCCFFHLKISAQM